MRIVKSNKTVKASTDKPDLKAMSDDQLRELLTDVINEREGFDEDDMSERALYLDDLYLDIDNELGERKADRVKACEDVKASKQLSANDRALTHIKAAIDILGKSGQKDEITKDTIANLGLVALDLKGDK